MTYLKSFVRKSRVQGVIFLLAVVTVYGYLARPVEAVRDIVTAGPYAFTAVGVAGVRVLDISDPAHIFEVAKYDTRGTANAVYYDAERKLLFVADGSRGVLVLNAADPLSLKEEIGQIDTRNALDVFAAGKYIYVADGNNGLQIIQWKDTKEPKGVGGARPKGLTQALAMQGKWLLAGDSRGVLHLYDVSKVEEVKESAALPVNAPVNEIVLSGTRALLAAGPQGFIIVDWNDKENLAVLGRLDTEGLTQGVHLDTVYAYLADGRRGVRMVDVSDPANIRQIQHWGGSGNATRLAMTGKDLFVAQGLEGVQAIRTGISIDAKEVVKSRPQMEVERVVKRGDVLYLSAGERGLRLLDVSDGRSPREINLLDTPGFTGALAVSGSIAYFADWPGGLDLVDISNPRDPLSIFTSIRPENAPRESVLSDVVVANDHAFVAQKHKGLAIFSLANPTQPVQVGAAALSEEPLRLVVERDWAYLTSAGEKDLIVVNIKDLERPTSLASLSLPGQGRSAALVFYRLEGQVLKFVPEAARNDAKTRAYLLVAAGDRGLRVVDVTDPEKPKETGSLELNGFTYDVVAGQSRAYVGAGNVVRAIDISDPTQPRELGSLALPAQVHSLWLDGERLFVANSTSGARILDVKDPAHLKEIGYYEAPAGVKGISLVDRYVFVADGKRGVWVYDTIEDKTLREISFYPTAGPPSQVIFFSRDGQTYAAISCGSAGLQIASVSNGYQLAEVSTLGINQPAWRVALRGDRAYVASGEKGIQVVNITNLGALKAEGSYDTPGQALGVATFDEEYVLVADGSEGLHILSVTGDRPPEKVRAYPGLDVRGVAVRGSYAYLAAGNGGLRIWDIHLPLQAREVSSVPTAGAAEDVTLYSIYAFLSNGSGGVQIVDISDPLHPQTVGGTVVQPPFAAHSAAVTTVPDQENGKPSKLRIYLAGDQHGFLQVEGYKTGSLDLNGLYNTPGTASLAQIRAAVFQVLGGNISTISPKVSRTLGQVTFDFVVLGGLGVLFWLFLMAQVVLPSRKLGDRVQAYYRLIAYLTGRHGLAAHIRDGVLVQSAGEHKRRGFGVVLVDPVSAAVLARRPAKRTVMEKAARRMLRVTKLVRWKSATGRDEKKEKPAPMRVVGPGIHFTDYQRKRGSPQFDETVEGVVDLRNQVRIEPNVLARTRDGLEVNCNVFSVFTLGQAPDVLMVTYVTDMQSADRLRVLVLENRIESTPVEGGGHVRRVKKVVEMADELDEVDKLEIHHFYESVREGKMPPNRPTPEPQPGAPFLFDPERVFAAVRAKALDDRSEETLHWTDLPAKAAVEILRNMLSLEMYDALYRPEHPSEYRMSRMKALFGRRLRNQGVLSYQLVLRRDGAPLAPGQDWNPADMILFPVQDLRSPKVLRSRGIKVITGGFSELKPASPEVRSTMLDNWRAQREQEADRVRADYDHAVIRIRSQARIKAQRDLVYTIAKIFRTTQYSQEALCLQVMQALETAASDPATRALMPRETIEMLRSLKYWLLPEGGPGSEEHPTPAVPPEGSQPELEPPFPEQSPSS